MAFNPPVIVPSSPTNTFTTIEQPHGVSGGVWRGEREPSIASLLTEQGILPEVPIDLTHPTPSGGFASDKNVICRWVTPPYQTVGGVGNPEYIDAGIMAFHYSGIKKVEFFLNGATNPLIVTEVTYNPEKDITAYWVRITADQLTDSGDVYHQSVDSTVSTAGTAFGRANSPVYRKHHELQAVVYPNDGTPRILVGKPNNGNEECLYNGLPVHVRSDGKKYRLEDNGIRSLYFSSNRTNTLFEGSVYVDAANGIDDLARNGTIDEPMKTIEFAFRKLMQLKFKFYNPLNPNNVLTEGDVGGGKIYLMDLGEGPSKFLGHKMGYKNIRDQAAPSTVSINKDNEVSGFPFRCLAHRWVTITPDPRIFLDSSNPSLSEKRRAKLKGFHPQIVPSEYKVAGNKGIICPLQKYENCFLENDYPYTEYLFGDGPVLDSNETTSKLQFTNKWGVKKGIASKTTWSASNQLCPMWAMNETDLRIYTHVNATTLTALLSQTNFTMPPRTWFINCEVDGGRRTPERIYDWANAMGLTYSTTMITPFNHNTINTVQQIRDGMLAADPTTPPNQFVDVRDLQIQHEDGTVALGGTYANFGAGSVPTFGNPLQIDKVPSIFVKSLSNITGYCANAGYTFNFSWVTPIGSHTHAQFETAANAYIFVENTALRRTQEPGQCRFDMFINSTIDQCEGDIFLGSGVIYQPFIIHGYPLMNAINDSSTTFARAHSDILQSNGGQFSYFDRQVGMNNLIFYRLNNPSPRSPRYDDVNKRHGLTGTGKIVNPVRIGQGFFSGQVKTGEYVHSDGITYTYSGTPYYRDHVYCDNLVKLEDGSQQLHQHCRHENVLIYNHQMIASNQESPTQTQANDQTGRSGGPSTGVRRYVDAVPSANQTNMPLMDNTNTHVGTPKLHGIHDTMVYDNMQIYKTDPATFDTQSDSVKDTYQERLKIFVFRKVTGNTAANTKVGIDYRSDFDNNFVELQDNNNIVSDLDYPFDANTGRIGDGAKIFFPVNDLDKMAFLREPLDSNGLRPQPNASTRGIWWQNNLPSTIPGAPYGWWPSEVLEENFRDKPTEKLGTGGDPTLGTGKSNPQPTDAGYNPNQRGFRNKLIYAYTLFDYDKTRDSDGRQLPRSTFISEESASGASNPPPISNHPLTIRLSTTDVKPDVSWNNKQADGATHGPDSIYPSSMLFQIPNYLERIEDITDPANDPGIGPSRSPEVAGNNLTEIGGQGGVYVTGGVVDITLNPDHETRNSINVLDILNTFKTHGRGNGGNTMSLIIHGKSTPDVDFGEYKYVAPESLPRDQWDDLGGPLEIDTTGIHYENFYKKFAYIAFHSKEAAVTSVLTSNQISFRKGPHHTYINFARTEMDGLSLSNGATGLSYVDLITGTQSVTDKVAKLQGLVTGITCSINTYGEFTSANKTNGSGTNPPTVTCTNKTRKFVGLVENGNKIVLQGIAASGTNSLFSNTTARYEHNAGVGAANQTYLKNTVDQNSPHYAMPIPGVQEPGQPPEPEPTIHFRFLNPIGAGTKNLLAYKVPTGGTRLFGGSQNLGITAGSYVRISGSSSNNGIYQVLSVADGIADDVASNTKTDGSTEYQYLELSRAITTEEQATGKNITIENVSHLPILHIKYRTPL